MALGPHRVGVSCPHHIFVVTVTMLGFGGKGSVSGLGSFTEVGLDLDLKAEGPGCMPTPLTLTWPFLCSLHTLQRVY